MSDADDMKSDGFRLPLKMKCKQVVYRSVYQNCSNRTNAANRFQCALKCGVDHILGAALRLL